MTQNVVGQAPSQRILAADNGSSKGFLMLLS